MKSRTSHLGISLAVLFLLSGCAAPVTHLPAPVAVSDQTLADGRRLIASYGCGSCHYIPGIPGADARIGPPLDRFYERSYIAGQLPNTWGNLIQWIQEPQQLKPGTAMPDMGITPDQAFEIAAYLYHQPSPTDWFKR